MTNPGQNRPSRFPSYAAASNGADRANGTDRSQQTRPSTFQPSAGPWNNSTSANGAFGRSRDAATPRGQSAREALLRTETAGSDGFTNSNGGLSNGPSGSSALAATSEADPWNGPSASWNVADTTQARTLPGSAAPLGRPDASIHATNTNYHTSASAIGQRGLLASMTTSSTALDTSSGAFANSSHHFSNYEDDEESLLPFGLPTQAEADTRRQIIQAAQRRAQEISMLAAMDSGPSRNSVSSHSGSDHLHSQTNSFGDFAFGAPNATPLHSQRPSLAGPSFPTANGRGGYDSNLGSQTDQEPLAETFARLAMESGRNGSVNGPTNGLLYGAGANNFQFNPGSQPWGNGQGYGAYANGPDFERRGSMVDRGSPAGSSYRVGGAVNSPRGLASTPQQGADAWSRPGSRDPRMGSDFDRRGLGQQHPMQQPSEPFMPGASYGPSFHNYGHVYNQFAETAHGAHIPGFFSPMAHFGFGPGAGQLLQGRDDDPGRTYRSALLHDFKYGAKSSSRRLELKDIARHVVEFSSDQNGSRFIQHKLETANGDEKDLVFREVQPNAIPLMKDLFGNYVVQKFFEHGTQIQKRVLLGAMKGQVLDLSMQMYACRVVQKALEYVLVEQQAEIVKELEADIMKLIKDQHGNHVVQQAITRVPRQHIDFIMDAVKNRVCELASHQFGCRVVQRILEHGNAVDKAAVAQELHKSAETLIPDVYGNYVMQHLIALGTEEDRLRMFRLVQAQLMAFSRNKHASNVVEKCIECGTQEQQRAIRDQLIGNGEENCPLFQLTKDQFGNYVVQRLIKDLQQGDKEVLLRKLRPQLPTLRKANGAGKLIAALERTIAEFGGVTRDITPASTAPTSPGLRVDISSAAPTPMLTMDPNSPWSTPSSGPPFTNGEAAEAVSNGVNGQPTKVEGGEADSVSAQQPHIGDY